MIRAEIVAEARRWIGTPYHIGARVRGVGVDCAQFIIGVALACDLMTEGQAGGVPFYDISTAAFKKTDALVSELSRCDFQRKPIKERLPGDLLIFYMGKDYGHVGIDLGDNILAHAQWRKPICKVVAIRRPSNRQRQRCYAFPGVI